MHTKDVANRTGANIQTVRNWIKKGRLEASKKKKGLKYYYEISEKQFKEFADKYLTSIFL